MEAGCGNLLDPIDVVLFHRTVVCRGQHLKYKMKIWMGVGWGFGLRMRRERIQSIK